MEALLMLKVETVLHFGKILVGSLLIAGLAGPAFAGNVWTWRTEDGAFAFTDDSKRIPAKHRAEAKRRSMGKLTRYERYTEISADTEKPYVDRLRIRQSELRERTSTAPKGAVRVAAGSNKTGIAYGISVSGGQERNGTTLLVPVDGDQTSSESQPTTIQSIRVRTRGSLADSHWTVVKKGDRIVTVIKGQPGQRSLDGVPESDFDL